TFTDWELIVVDDGSTDDTRGVVARHADDVRVRCLSQTHAERSAARNRGIAASSGRLIAFLDADDLWLPEEVAGPGAAVDAHPGAGFCYTPARFIDAAGAPLALRKPKRTIAGDVFARLVRGNVIILASVVVRRAALERVGGFDASLAVYGCEDWDLWLRLAREHPVVVVAAELTLYRKHAANTAWQRGLESELRVPDKCYAEPTTAE